MRLSPLEALGAVLVSSAVAMSLSSFAIGTVVVFPRSELPYSPPTALNPLGTNDLGDDVLTLLMQGGKVSLLVGFMGSLISTTIGTVIGALAGFFRGVVDELLSGLTDLFIVIPALPLMIVLAAYLSPSFWNLVLVIGLLWWPVTARLVRARAQQLKSSQFVESLVGIGAGRLYIVFRHILPNVMGVALSRFILGVSYAILLEAGLSFIGLGDPTVPSWGTMLHFAMTRGALLNGSWWVFVPPGLAISTTSLGFLLLGMGLERRVKLSSKSLVEVA
ncbi:MAG: ABC transporter permease [Candidatus Nezhaarchaeota archaeon]|nr:ABC transporter permease [Candidatus Nezhaarchaeota archaeon]